MENQNKFKLRFSRMFRSSFGSSCRSKNISDVIEDAVFTDNVPQNNTTTFHFLEQQNHHQEDQPTQASPKMLFPSICKPRPCPNHPKDTINNSCIVSAKSILNPGRKHPDPFPHFSLGLITNVEIPKTKDFHVKTKRNKTTRKKKMKNYNPNRPLSLSSQGSFNHDDWYSSDDERESSSEDETDTLFSSRTLSSDSSGRFGSSRTRRRQRRGGRRRRVKERDVGVLPMLVGNINNSFAVVKKSSDPYNDFRTSMVEMIVERQIFAAKDLEKLLQCFLSLNSHHHHKIIVEVFTEIWEALFSTWC